VAALLAEDFAQADEQLPRVLAILGNELINQIREAVHHDVQVATRGDDSGADIDRSLAGFESGNTVAEGHGRLSCERGPSYTGTSA
jgi:hypothetical protein